MNALSCLTWLAATLLPLGALWGLFRVALRGERCFGYNRALLLLAPLLAAGLPLLPRPSLPGWLAPARVASAPVPSVLLPALPAGAVAPAAPAPDLSWLGWVYAAGVGVGLARLAYRGGQLHRATRRLPRAARPGYTLACTGGQLPTSSFGRTIFWDETAGLAPAEATLVLAHELAHVRQGHSYDVLWLEVWRAVLWPNPFIYKLLQELRLTHELLADRGALAATATEPAALAVPYPALLARLALPGAVGRAHFPLLQSFTFSFTFTRLAMLQNQTPVRRWKQWLVLPVLGGLFLMGSHSAGAQRAAITIEPKQRASSEEVNRKLAEAMHQDSLRTGGKFEPGTSQQFNIENMDKAGEVRVTVMRVKAPMPTIIVGKENTPAPPIPYPKGKAPAPVVSHGEAVYTYVEQMPVLPAGGGMAGVVKQIQDNLVYPAGPHQEGRLFASFTVGATGEVRDARIVKSLSPAYDEAVLAAIQKLPRFVAGTQGGRPVAVSFTVPVLFKEKP